VLRPEDLVAIIDTREQAPLDLSPFSTVTDGLDTGDYSIRGLEHVVAVERKSLADLVACCGRERDRFERELLRLLAYPVRALVVEASWADVERGDWIGKVTPKVVLSSVLSWVSQGIPIVLASDRAGAEKAVKGLLWFGAKHRYEELRHLAGAVRVRKPSAPALAEAASI